MADLLLNKIKETFFRHKTRIDVLEEKILVLEKRVQQLENESTNPWKMPLD